MSPGAVLNMAPFVAALLGVVRQEAFDSRVARETSNTA
jgi:hypothetical protein